MKRNLLAFSALALLGGGWVLAQTQEEPYDFKDLKGNLRLWNSDGWSKTDDDNGNVTLDAAGKPVKAESKRQGLFVEANTIKTYLVNQGSGNLVFEWADLAGDVLVRQNRTTKEGKITRELKTQKLRLDEGRTTATTTFSSPFTATEKLDPTSGTIRPRTLHLEASSGVLTTSPYQQQNDNEIKGADLKAALVRLEQGARAGEKEPTTSVSTAKSATIDLAKGENYVLKFASRVDFTDDRKIQKQFGEGTQKITLSGDSGTITLDDLKAEGVQPLIKANLDGNINVILQSRNPIQDDVELTDITATGDKLTYDRASRTIRIEGRVKGTYTRKKGSTKPEDVNPYSFNNAWIEFILTEDFTKVLKTSGGGGTVRTGGGG